MSTITIKIEASELASAIAKLVNAVQPQNISTGGADTHDPTPATPAPTAAVPVNPYPTAATPLTPPAPTERPVGPVAPQPIVPTTEPSYTVDDLGKAGGSLVDAGKMDALLALLDKYGIQTITQLQPAQFGIFATELRALGAQI